MWYVALAVVIVFLFSLSTIAAVSLAFDIPIWREMRRQKKLQRLAKGKVIPLHPFRKKRP